MSSQLDRVRSKLNTSTDGLNLYAWESSDDATNTRRGADELTGWRVIDDWPRPVPVTPDEIDVFEAWFGDILDELFGPI